MTFLWEALLLPGAGSVPVLKPGPRCSACCPDVSSPSQLKDGGGMKADLEAALPSGQERFAIRCRDVCRSYGKLKVLSSLNLSVPQGQM